MLKSFVFDTGRPVELRVYNGQEIKLALPPRMGLSTRRRQASSSMRREEKGGGESRGGERYLNHNLKISTRRLAKKEGEEGTNHMRQWEFVCRMPGNKKDPSYYLGRMWFKLII